MEKTKFTSVFSPSTAEQRSKNFADYWLFTQAHGGDLLEADRNLAKKKARLEYFQNNPVRLRKPLENTEVFYHNYVHLKDKVTDLDRKTLLLCAIYKFARHELNGIEGAWDVVPDTAHSCPLEDKISRVHLAEEFCHVRLFNEMLVTCGLDKVEWVPLVPWQQFIYRQFPKFPGFLMDAPAFITELMGVIFYFHLYGVIDDVFSDEPEVRDRLKEMLDEITIDEIAHVGQRRNFIGELGIKFSQWMIKPLFVLFFKDIPETALLFDVDRMIQDAQDFDYNNVPDFMLEKTWIPSYCQ